MIIKFKVFESTYNSDTYVGPAIVNTIAATVVGDGSDGIIGGQNNPGDLGGEFPKKYNPPTNMPVRHIPNILRVRYKESKRRKKAIQDIEKVDVMTFDEFKKKKENEKIS